MTSTNNPNGQQATSLRHSSSSDVPGEAITGIPDGKCGSKPKKARYSRQQKREHKELRRQQEKLKQEQQQSQGSSPQAPPRTRKRPRSEWSWKERIDWCVWKAKDTCAVVAQAGDPESRAVRVVTTSASLSEQLLSTDAAGSKEGRPVIRVRPLLILDLNGILCHRSRRHREPQGVVLRSPIGSVAGTPVVPRTDLEEFLGLVAPHFCLAVWTSAKASTAKKLLGMLMPPELQRRLLFVWGQNECSAVRSDDPSARDSVVFEKRLDKVWERFPLWSASNTLLVDDSPRKCPFAPSNAVHPPALHGQAEPPLDSEETPWKPDHSNEAIQRAFFRGLVQHWQDRPHEDVLTEETLPGGDPSSGRGVPVREESSNSGLLGFLREHGSGHMGWRGDSL